MPNKKPSGEKKNFWTWTQGAMNALMKFGGLSPKGDVTSSWSVTGLDGRHFIVLDEDGQRTAWTLMNSPGGTIIHTGEDVTKEEESFFLLAHNGDIHLKAANGKIRMEADSIEMVANGTAGEGTLWINANERVKIDSKNITIESKQSLKLVSAGVASLKGKPIDIIGSLITGVSKATNPDIKPGDKVE
jgi:hypothetical protein|tara:strand:+ start:770 stop:1333 length:564 start_codon:yes stop_codon:yes gene_type:complete